MHVSYVLFYSKMQPTVHAYVTVLCSTALVVPVEGAWCAQLHTVSKAKQTNKREQSRSVVNYTTVIESF